MKTIPGGWYCGIGGALVAALLAACAAQQYGSVQSADGVTVGESDLGGVVTSANGPEAGVWVIAETTDLPTKYAKMVVTDERGRYVLPGLPRANYSVWVRGYGLVDSPKVRTAPGKLLNLAAVPAPSEAAAAQYYPAIYWYSMLTIPGADQFGGKSKVPGEDDAGGLAEADEKHRLHRLPPARPGLHALDPGSLRQRRVVRGGMDTSHAVRPVRRADDEPARRQLRRRAVSLLRGLDRPHREGRVAVREAAAAAGRRAQRRRHLVGVEHPQALSARSHRLGPAQSDSQRSRSGLRLSGVLDGQHADPGSEERQGHDVQDAGRRSGHAGIAGTRPCREHEPAGALGLLGRGKALGHARQQPQRHVRQAGPGVDGRHRARQGQSGVLPKGIQPSLGEGLRARAVLAAGGDARPEDDEIHVRRHLLRHASSAVRLRRRQYPVAFRHGARWRAG